MGAKYQLDDAAPPALKERKTKNKNYYYNKSTQKKHNFLVKFQLQKTDHLSLHREKLPNQSLAVKFSIKLNKPTL